MLAPPSAVIKRSAVIGGHKTSLSLENEFWDAIKEIAARKGVSLTELLTQIDQDRDAGNFSSAVRLYVLTYHRERWLRGEQ